ncbi:MAG TPA: outer membrane beta-barrel protein [Candidatus Deferrimicrobium sp.]|nr:outer membrane beta-barrel protein [Candidatus Deferrimicrobium sp.]
MKTALVIGACLMAFALGASAQVPTPFSFYAGGALSLPNAPEGFKESFNSGYHGLVGIGYKLGPGFQLVGKAEYHKFSSDLSGFPGVDGGDANVWLFGGDGRLALGLPVAPIKPFGLLGFGLATIDQSDFSGPVTLIAAIPESYPDKQSKLYYNFGAGVEFKFGPAVNLFVQGRYVSVSSEGGSTGFVPVTVGLKFF